MSELLVLEARRSDRQMRKTDQTETNSDKHAPNDDPIHPIQLTLSTVRIHGRSFHDKAKKQHMKSRFLLKILFSRFIHCSIFMPIQFATPFFKTFFQYGLIGAF